MARAAAWCVRSHRRLPWPREFVAHLDLGVLAVHRHEYSGSFDSPSHGKFLFNDVDVTKLPRDGRALLRRHFLGFVFQGYNLLNRTTAIENVELPLIYRGTSKHERRERAVEALHLVGLNGREHHTPSELSGGQHNGYHCTAAHRSSCSPAMTHGNLDTAIAREIMALLVS